MSPHAIRWTDDLGEINLIGPYPTVVERDAQMRRLAALPGMNLVELLPSRTDRMCAATPTPPAALAAVTDVEEFLAAVGTDVLYVSPQYLRAAYERVPAAVPDDFAALMVELAERAEGRRL